MRLDRVHEWVSGGFFYLTALKAARDCILCLTGLSVGATQANQSVSVGATQANHTSISLWCLEYMEDKFRLKVINVIRAII